MTRSMPFLIKMVCHYIRLAAVLVFVVPYATSQDEVSRCPYNLIRNQYLHAYKERCFEFVVYQETYWPEAQKECAHKGGRLVTVDGIETQTFLEKTLQNLHFHKTGLWIGLNDMRHEDSYQWISGAPMRYTNWARGEPSFLHEFEDCIILQRNKGFRWADHSCDLPLDHFEYICEYDKLPVSTTRSSPPTTTNTRATLSSDPAQNTAKPTEPKFTTGKTMQTKIAVSIKHLTTTEVSNRSTEALITKHLTTTEVPNRSTEALTTKHLTTTEVPNRSTEALTTKHLTTTEVPNRSTEALIIKHLTTTEVPNRSTEALTTKHLTTKEVTSAAVTVTTKPSTTSHKTATPNHSTQSPHARVRTSTTEGSTHSESHTTRNV